MTVVVVGGPMPGTHRQQARELNAGREDVGHMSAARGSAWQQFRGYPALPVVERPLLAADGQGA
jgi:hypothetical protein